MSSGVNDEPQVACNTLMIYQYSSPRDLDGTHNSMINRHFGWVSGLKYQYPIKPRQSPPKPVDHMIKKPAKTRAEAGLSFEDFTQGGRLIYIMGQRPQHSWDVTSGSTLHPRGLQSSKSRKLIRDGIMPAMHSSLAEISPNTKPRETKDGLYLQSGILP